MRRQMKNIVLTALTIGLSLGINSCCTKKDCTGADDIYEINFYNFSLEDLDTIILISYSKNTNFTTIIDSSVTKADLKADYFSAYTNHKLNTDFDYKIKLFSTLHVYTLTGFEIEKKGCNTCFPYRPESDFYNKVSGYQINGQKQIGNQIKIYK